MKERLTIYKYKLYRKLKNYLSKELDNYYKPNINVFTPFKEYLELGKVDEAMVLDIGRIRITYEDWVRQKIEEANPVEFGGWANVQPDGSVNYITENVNEK